MFETNSINEIKTIFVLFKKTQADEAIQFYEQFKTTENGSDKREMKYPHWDEVFQKITNLWKGK